MRSLSVRGLLPMCAAAVTVAALAAPGSALAAKENPNCNGENIEGQGASTQKIIQQNFWNGEFNTNTASKKSCTVEGKKPKVHYNSTGSGAGLKSWGIETGLGETISFGPKNAYLGTDEPPNAAQIADLEAEESTPTAESVLTIPVMQVAVSVPVHLPEGCTVTIKGSATRLELSQATLEGIFDGSIKSFTAIKDGGEEVSCTGASGITVVVRKDQSGTTHIFKRFLNLVNGSELETEAGKKTWGDLSEGALNTVWPTAAGVVRPPANGGGELVKYVGEHAGTIGYASVADSQASKFFSEGGAGHATQWALVENENKKGKAKFADPSTNGETTTPGSANCKKTLYSNGANPFPPPSVTEPWNEVTSKTSEKTYAICGFSYDVSVTHYALLPGTSAGEAETVKAYEEYVTDKKGGQVALGLNDYLALPKEVLSIADAGAELIGD